MTCEPYPLLLEPIFIPKPWGGRTLERLFSKSLPAGPPIGESWEVASLPGEESLIRVGPLAGRGLADAVQMWGRALVGGAELVDGRFPLLVKFLDARENLSVQVHPRPRPDDPRGLEPGIKHEAWFVLESDPGAVIYVGARPGVTAEDFRRAGNTPASVDLLVRRPVKPGMCFYLPSGTPHALGAGVVVAEVQTPSDTTYRLYDWGRVGLDGKPRALHVEQALANLLCDVPEERIVQPRSHVGGALVTITKLVSCERFLIDRVRLADGVQQAFPHAEMVIWIVLAGHGRLSRGEVVTPFVAGDTVVIPADGSRIAVAAEADCDVLEVKIPIASPLAGRPHPPGEAAPRAGGSDFVPLGRPGA